MASREGRGRGYGVPLTEEERRRRHLEQYGTLDDFPEERGAGLSRVSGLTSIYHGLPIWGWAGIVGTAMFVINKIKRG